MHRSLFRRAMIVCVLSAAAVLLVSLSGCVAKDKFLSTYEKEPPAVQVAGLWEADGWGHGYIEQNGDKISGELGAYVVQGVVSGGQVYILFVSSGRTYYSATLRELRPGALEGRYFKGQRLEGGHSQPILMERTAIVTPTPK